MDHGILFPNNQNNKKLTTSAYFFCIIRRLIEKSIEFGAIIYTQRIEFVDLFSNFNTLVIQR